MIKNKYCYFEMLSSVVLMCNASTAFSFKYVKTVFMASTFATFIWNIKIEMRLM